LVILAAPSMTARCHWRVSVIDTALNTKTGSANALWRAAYPRQRLAPNHAAHRFAQLQRQSTKALVAEMPCSSSKTASAINESGSQGSLHLHLSLPHTRLHLAQILYMEMTRLGLMGKWRLKSITQIAAEGRPQESPKSRLGLGEDEHTMMNCASTVVASLWVAPHATVQRASMVSE
jgi:hypothetical protein